MQYKIPVQIENEDPILLGLSLRQLTIVMIGGWIGYSISKSLMNSLPIEIAAIPWVLLFAIALMIAKFKIAEMSFMQFILSFVRLKSNMEKRSWQQNIDSYSPLEIWLITTNDEQKDSSIDFSSKIDKINQLDEKIKNI